MDTMFLSVLVFLLLSGTSCDPCQDYITLNDARRLATYESTYADRLCDFLIDSDQWYRFTVGSGQIASSSIDPYHCGTVETVFMLGDHPTDDTPVSRTVCNNFNGPLCGDWVETISVRRCLNQANDFFYVYSLQPTPWCAMAYCVSEALSSYPSLDRSPSISNPIHSDDFRDPFYFNCSVYCTDTNPNVRFEVQLYFRAPYDSSGDNSDYQASNAMAVQRQGYVTQASFSEHELTGYMGLHVGCLVKTYYAGNAVSFSPEIFSDNTYWIGIRQLNEEESLTSGPGESAVITLGPTVPITCSSCPSRREECRIDIYEGRRQNDDRCLVSFDLINPTADITVEASMPTPPTHGPLTRTMYIVFNQVSTRAEECIWNDYQVNPISVALTVTDELTFATCTSVGDPHISTFDGHYFHMYAVGTFVLVGAPSRYFEIQATHRWCLIPGRACNCALAAREYNTVYIVDVCGHHPKYYMKRSSDQAPMGTIEWPSSNQFLIRFPSGALIKGQIYKISHFDINEPVVYYINIEVMLPPSFRFNVNGLCGNYDNDPGNDVNTNDHIGSNRVEEGRSFIYDEFYCDDVPLTHHPQCSCNGQRHFLCEYNTITVPDVPVPCNAPGDRKRRSVVDEIDYEVEFDDGYGLESNLEYPTPNGYLEEDMSNACRQILVESTFYYVCRGLINEDNYMASCIADSTLADDLTIGYDLLSVVSGECLFTAESGYVEENEEIPAIVQIIQQTVCPDQCLNRGQCVDSNCICDEGLIGSNCGISITDVPSINSFGNGAVCDIRQSNCTFVIVNAQPLTDQLNLKCVIQDVQLSDDGNHIVSTEQEEVDSFIVNTWAMICNLPISPVHEEYNGQRHSEHGYMISVSIDGENFCEPKLFVIHDSNCKECNEDGICWFQENTCFDNGECRSIEYCDESMCASYTDIGIPFRSTSYISQTGGLRLCDNDIDNGIWYRFSQYTGGLMPTFCPEPFACGTLYPIWLNGTHPDVEEPIVHAMACAAIDDQNNCCEWSAPVSVRYCNMNNEAYFVYRLVQTPFCPMSYCSGNIEPCPYGYTWDETEEECIQVQWSQWYEWNDCSVSCGVGQRTRWRVCPSLEGCIGDRSESEECNTGECPPEWLPWNTWSACSASCSFGTRERTRECSQENECGGYSNEHNVCVMRECAESQEENDDQDNKRVYIPGAIFGALVFVGILFVCSVIAIKKFLRPPRSVSGGFEDFPTSRAGSVAYVGNVNMATDMTPDLKLEKTNILHDDDFTTNNVPPQGHCTNFKEMRPKTGHKPYGRLPPLMNNELSP